MSGMGNKENKKLVIPGLVIELKTSINEVPEDIRDTLFSSKSILNFTNETNFTKEEATALIFQIIQDGLKAVDMTYENLSQYSKNKIKECFAA